jgi:polyhydroxybutyrate depolymerase
MRRRITAAALGLAAAACLGGAAARAQQAGPGSITHQGIARHYELHLPHAGTAAPRPLVIALHGISNGEDWRRPVAWLRAWWSMDAVAEREGFAIVYPAALTGRWSYSAQRPVQLPGRDEVVDDSGFLAALIDRLVAGGVADPARVFVVGASRGGLMAWAMACGMSGRIAGAAPLITGMTDGQLEPCRPARLVPLLVIAGTNDRTQSYDGWLAPDFRLLSVPETMEFWRRLHGCTGQSGRILPHRDPGDPTRVLRIDWTGCAAGDGRLRLLRIEGGGHQLPSFTPLPDPPRWAGRQNRDIETAEEVWRFFADIAPTPPVP